MNLNLLSQKYASKDMDFRKAIQTWKEAHLSPENIREQVRYDIGVGIDSGTAKELYKLGSEIEKGDGKLKEFGMAKGDEKNDPFYAINYSNQNKNYGGMEAIAKDFKVSKGREDLLPDNIRNRDRIKFTPSIRRAFDKIGENLYRDKVAAKYWTLKKKRGEDGQDAVYLVAVETDDGVKTASTRKIAEAPAGSVAAPQQTATAGGANPAATQATPTDPGTQQNPTTQQSSTTQQNPSAEQSFDPAAVQSMPADQLIANIKSMVGDSKFNEIATLIIKSYGESQQATQTPEAQAPAAQGTEGQPATATTPGVEGQPAQ